MKAYLDRWSVEQRGPAFSTRREESDGSVSYEAIHTVSLTFTVIGNDASEFIRTIENLQHGDKITGLSVQAGRDKIKDSARKYVFN